MNRLALWVTPVANLAGVARHVLDAARAGIPGWQMQVAAPEGPLLDRLRELGITCHPVTIGAEVSTPTAVRALRAVIRQVRPDVVHSHLARADFLLAAAATRLPVATVSTEHGIAGDDRLYHGDRLTSALRKGAHHVRTGRFDALIAVSESTRDQMRRAWRPRTPLTVIPNGVDPRPMQRATGMRFLSLSRLSHEKNIAALLEAFALVRRDHPRAHLTVGGEGPEHDALVSRAQELGVAPVVDFCGFVDSETAMASHEVVVQLSAWENTSYTLLDAVVSGLGVVATPVGGNPEILPPHCLARATEPDQVAQRMVEQARQIAQRPVLPPNWPTVAQMTARIAEVYRTLPAPRTR